MKAGVRRTDNRAGTLRVDLMVFVALALIYSDGPYWPAQSLSSHLRAMRDDT